MAEPKKAVLDPDWLPMSESSWEAGIKPLDDGQNPRLIVKLNVSVKQPFYSILEAPGLPPLAVCVVRADLDVPALGVLEKLKIMVVQMQKKFNLGSKLSEGVREAATKDLTKGAIK